MTKAELVGKVAEAQGVSKVQAGKIVGDLVDILKLDLLENGKTQIPGIGTLNVVELPATEGESFGKKWTRPAGVKKVKFTQSTTIAKEVN